jgi:hypothetical protein
MNYFLGFNKTTQFSIQLKILLVLRKHYIKLIVIPL